MMYLILFVLFFTNSISSSFSEVLDDCVCGQETHYRPKSFKNERIVNGSEVLPNKYPWMAIMTNQEVVMCGGSIITDRTILTAGHCVLPSISPEIVNWIVGVHSVQEAFNNKELSYRFQSIHLHPHYRRISYIAIYDLSIFVLDRQITFGPKIHPICLPNDGDDKLFWNRKVTVAGWGLTSMYGYPTDLLMETNVVLKTDEECKNILESTGFSSEGMICAHEDLTDACKGDSGGPLFVEKSQNHHVILGVVSWGKGCAEAFPGIYAKVSDSVTLDWIDSITKMAEANECRNPENF